MGNYEQRSAPGSAKDCRFFKVLPTVKPAARLPKNIKVPFDPSTPPWCEQTPRIPMDGECHPSRHVVGPRSDLKHKSTQQTHTGLRGWRSSSCAVGGAAAGGGGHQHRATAERARHRHSPSKTSRNRPGLLARRAQTFDGTPEDPHTSHRQHTGHGREPAPRLGRLSTACCSDGAYTACTASGCLTPPVICPQSLLVLCFARKVCHVRTSGGCRPYRTDGAITPHLPYLIERQRFFVLLCTIVVSSMTWRYFPLLRAPVVFPDE